MDSNKPIIVVPMAGQGSRFATQGYSQIKPLIEIRPGLPMIEAVVNSVGIDADYIFIVQQTHRYSTNVEDVLNRIRPGCKIIDTGGGVTEGAACTVLLAQEHFDNHRPLIIVNSDNILSWPGQDVFDEWVRRGTDGLILTFFSQDSKYSYVGIDEKGFVNRVAEKKVISDRATAGLYGWKSGSDFITAATKMIKAEDRVNGEFYVAPVYNWNISIEIDHHFPPFLIDPVPIWEMIGVGTPEDLREYQARRSHD